MRSTIQPLMSIGMLLSAVTALPTTELSAPEPNEGLILLHSEPTNYTIGGDSRPGVLSFYGDASPIDTRDSLPTKRACGSNDVICNSSNRARVHVCQRLIYSASVSSSSNVPTSPRSICETVQDSDGPSTCCISWANEVPAGTAQRFELQPAAFKVLNSCSTNIQTVSGLTRNTLIGDWMCTTQCLSNRPGGCS